MKGLRISLAIGILMILLLGGMVSAMDWDNVKSYNEESQTITITNALGFGERLARIQLMTPLDNKVLPGEDVKVALLKIHEYKKMEGAMTGIDTYDMLQGRKLVGKKITMKYKENYEIEVPNITDFIDKDGNLATIENG
ncbi:MAG: hypothetical protein ACP5D2_05230, partial [Candidatus Nanoarchaeia archaeon]